MDGLNEQRQGNRPPWWTEAFDARLEGLCSIQNRRLREIAKGMPRPFDFDIVDDPEFEELVQHGPWTAKSKLEMIMEIRTYATAMMEACRMQRSAQQLLDSKIRCISEEDMQSFFDLYYRSLIAESLGGEGDEFHFQLLHLYSDYQLILRREDARLAPLGRTICEKNRANSKKAQTTNRANAETREAEVLRLYRVLAPQTSQHRLAAVILKRIRPLYKDIDSVRRVIRRLKEEGKI